MHHQHARCRWATHTPAIISRWSPSWPAHHRAPLDPVRTAPAPSGRNVFRSRPAPDDRRTPSSKSWPDRQAKVQRATCNRRRAASGRQPSIHPVQSLRVLYTTVHARRRNCWTSTAFQVTSRFWLRRPTPRPRRRKARPRNSLCAGRPVHGRYCIAPATSGRYKCATSTSLEARWLPPSPPHFLP